ncbi:MAG TPA: universal stress protein [Vicinamibacterales bacterium]|nr:universal stress protein [Vicinamibacterales bacterium]
MIRIAHVLCPVDFSEISRHALDHAAAIARWHEARLTLLYVFANLPTMDLPPLVLEDADRERLMSDLRRMAAAVPREVPVDVRVHEAEYVHTEILAQLGATHADLLVLGTHGRSGFQRLFLGSVTEKVIRRATCPTMVVPPRAPDVPAGAPIQFRRILCAVDFSESSLEALAYAITMAEEADARLTLLHVVELPPVLVEEPALDLSRVREAAAANARRRLHELIPEQARTYCTVETAVVEGRAYREILRHATERWSDLIVMGVHGRGATDLLVFGSTTHHIIRASTCPVLIVRRS